MQIGRLIRRAIRATVPPALFIGLTCYFGWNAMQGAHGIKSYTQQLTLLQDAKQAKLDAVAEHDAWARRVNGLSEKQLDADILDERGRAMLNLARGNDIVVPYPAHEKLY